MDDTNQAIPWWQSRIILGIVISLVTKVLVLSGLTGEISSEAQAQILNAALLIIGGAADLYAVLKRVKQQAAPVITATASKAAEINAPAPSMDPTEGGAWPLVDEGVK